MNATNTLNELESQHSGKLTAEATERLATIALVADIIQGGSPAKKKVKSDSPWVVPKVADKVRNVKTGEEGVVMFLTTKTPPYVAEVPTPMPEFAIGLANGPMWTLSEIEPVA